MLDTSTTTLINISPPVLATLIGIAGTIVISTVVDRIRLGTRVSLLESHRVEHNKTLDELEKVKDPTTERVASIEAVVPELRHLIDAMRDVPTILSRLDT